MHDGGHRSASHTAGIETRTNLSRLASPWILSIALFVIAFAPRVAAAGAYVTVDEEHWLARSVEFVYGIFNGDLAVLPSVHPGVTAMWGFGSSLIARFYLGGDLSSLARMRAEGIYDIPELLPTAALFTALVTSLTVVVSYLLLRKIGGNRFAFLAALLIALDPYLLANSRRVHLDAILASTMYLAAVAALVYAGWSTPQAPRRYLVLSGIFAGLAWLTKVTALYLLPFTLLVLAGRVLVSAADRRPDAATLWREAKSLLLWLAVAGLTFYALWPAMWVQPVHALSELVRGVQWGLDVPHGGPGATGQAAMHFFLGKIVNDPGPAYYPVTSLFRLSPLAFVFFPAGIVAVVAGMKRRTIQKPTILVYWLGMAYVFFFVIMLSLGAKKLESYALPIFPMIDTLAGVGLVACLRWLAHRWQQRRRDKEQPAAWPMLYGLAVASIILVSWLWLRLVPYYSAYFNPLLGGPRQAAKLYAFGGGEGLDMAAGYLNQKQDAERLLVSTPYDQAIFQYYFRGTALPAGRKNWTGSWLMSDYVISYHSYAQRDRPSPEVVDFWATLEPEYVARINGIDYARVYKVPPLIVDGVPAIDHPTSVNLGDQVTFLGYDLDTPQLESGGDIELTLYWQSRQPLQTDYSVYLRLLNGVDQVWGTQDGSPLQGMMPTSFWDEGMVIVDKRRLPIWPGTPPGSYLVEIGMYDPATMRHLEPEGTAERLLLGPVAIVQGLAGGAPVPQHPIDANLDGQVRLLGYDLEGQVAPGGNLHLTLFWEALSTPREDYTVFVHLVDEQGQIRAQGDSQPVAGYHPTSRWTEGEIVRDQYHLALPETVTTGEYTLLAGMYQPGTGVRLPVLGKGTAIMGDRITLGTLEVTGP